MRIQTDKFRAAVRETGTDEQALAEAIVRKGLALDRARSAVRNWRAGRDEPKAKRQDIEKLSDALGVEAKDIARFVSETKHAQTSPRKTSLVVEMIRGQRVDEAVTALQFCNKRAAKFVLKTLKSAIADAEQLDADVSRLYVVESRVNKGSALKRFQPKDRGRAHPFQKIKSHITIGLEEAE